MISPISPKIPPVIGLTRSSINGLGGRLDSKNSGEGETVSGDYSRSKRTGPVVAKLPEPWIKSSAVVSMLVSIRRISVE